MRKLVGMRNAFKLTIASLTLVSGLALCMPDAHAVSRSALLRMCDNSPGCKYHHNKDGSVQGCSKTCCFSCDKKGKCWSACEPQ